MNRLALALVLSAANGATFAQSQEPAKAAGGTAAQVKVIDASYQEAVKRVYAAKTEAEEKVATEEFQALRRTLIDRALGLAKDHPGDPESVDALAWVIQNGNTAPEARIQAMEILRRDQIASERLVEACRWASNTIGMESLAAERLLRDAIAKSPHRMVRGWAHFSLGELLKSRADLVRDIDKLPPAYSKWIGEAAIKQMSSRTPDDLFREAEASYSQVARSYADLNHPRTGKTLGEVAEGRAYGIQNLTIGRTLPEIAGVDVDGKPLKLSDYRGKVILLTFSGLWCPSCHTLYPQERELLNHYKGQPFAVLSVDTDEDKGPLRKAIASGEITWPCWWDGGVGGPITVRNGIFYFPTVFLIDHKGVVRYKDLQEKELDEAVERLLKEKEAEKR
jgi:thiol-disulfide isomerase/thioredoxin